MNRRDHDCYCCPLQVTGDECYCLVNGDCDAALLIERYTGALGFVNGDDEEINIWTNR